MKLLKKPKFTKKKKKTTLGNAFKVIDHVAKLKEDKLLQTTGNTFYTFRQLLSGPSPDNFAKNLFLYGRTTSLIPEGGVLYIRNIETEEHELIGQYTAKDGYVPIS